MQGRHDLPQCVISRQTVSQPALDESLVERPRARAAQGVDSLPCRLAGILDLVPSGSENSPHLLVGTKGHPVRGVVADVGPWLPARVAAVAGDQEVARA